MSAEPDRRGNEPREDRRQSTTRERHGEHLAALTLASTPGERSHVQAVSDDGQAHDVRVGRELLERLGEALALAPLRPVALREAVVVALCDLQEEVRRVPVTTETSFFIPMMLG